MPVLNLFAVAVFEFEMLKANPIHSVPNTILHRPLIPVALAVAAGIAAGGWMPGHIRLAWLTAGFLAVVLLGWIALGKPSALTPMVFCFWCGYLSIQPWLGAVLPPDHVARFADKGRWKVTGTVAQAPQYGHGRWHLILAAQRLDRATQRHVVRGLVKVTGRGYPDKAIEAGDRISLEGRLKTIRSFKNPGGFDYKRHMALQAVHARLFARVGSVRLTASQPKSGSGAAVHQVRVSLCARMDAALAAFSPDTVHLLKLILLGDRSGMTLELRRAFSRAGVGHVLAISGLHVGMVAAFVFGMARWLLSWVPAVLRYAWSGKGAALVSLMAVLGYGVMAGLSPSTQRAMIMAAAFLVRLWVGRRYDWLNALALAALAIMVAHPPAVLGISFQLSFAAVLALIAGTHVYPVAALQRDHSFGRRIASRLAAILWISILAILGTLPLTAFYFNQVSLVGLATNLAVVPLVGLVTLPVGLTGMLCSIMGLGTLSSMCWQASALSMELIRMVVTIIDAWPWAAVSCITPTGFEIGLYYISGGILLFWRRLPGRAAMTLAVLFLWCLDGAYWYYQRYGSHDLRATAIDVGQGSSTLLELPGGYTVLVDGGGFGDNRLFDVGHRIIAPVLWQKRIKTVDLIVLSHPNSDHLNGLLYLLDAFTVHEVWDNGETAATAGYRRWLQLIKAKGIQRSDFRTMPRLQMRHGVELEILSPPADFLQRRAGEPWRDTNNNSMVLKVRYGAGSILLTGDIGVPTEHELLRLYPSGKLHSSVLMVPHHGSAGSSSNAFVQAVAPEHAVISCGWRNRFGFPHPKVVQRLEAIQCRIWSTPQCGAIQVVLNQTGCRVTPLRPGCLSDSGAAASSGCDGGHRRPIERPCRSCDAYATFAIQTPKDGSVDGRYHKTTNSYCFR